MNDYKKWAILGPLFLVLVIDTMGAAIIFPILGPLFITKTHSILPATSTLNERQLWYGIVLAAWSALMFIGAPYLGDLSDKLGRKKVLLLALFGTAIGFMISGWGIQHRSLWLLILGRLVAGFFAGSQPIAQAVIADISDTQDKALNMSYIILANCVGYIIGPIAGGYLADERIMSWFSYSTPFYLGGLLALVNAGLLLFTLRESFEPKTDIQPSLLRGLTVVLQAFVNKTIRLHALIYFLLELSWMVFFLYTPIFMVEALKFDKIAIAHTLSYMGILFAFSLTAGIRLFIHFLNLEMTVILSLIIMAVALIFVTNLSHTYLWWILIPIALGASISYSVMVTVCSNLVPADKQGWIMGITSSLTAAAFGVGAISVGMLGWVSARFPFDLAAVLAVVSAGLLYWQLRPK